MRQLECEHQERGVERYCRQCGAQLRSLDSAARDKHRSMPAKDPDELVANGIGTVIVGDGMMMVAVILSATDNPVSSLLWLLLLIPAFVFFGKGFADVFHAQQIRKRSRLNAANSPEVLAPASQMSVTDIVNESISGELASVPSVTERTTRNLS